MIITSELFLHMMWMIWASSALLLKLSLLGRGNKTLALIRPTTMKNRQHRIYSLKTLMPTMVLKTSSFPLPSVLDVTDYG